MGQARSELADGTYQSGCVDCLAPLDGFKIVIEGGWVGDILRHGETLPDTDRDRTVTCKACGKEQDVYDEATTTDTPTRED